jgi:hypothetical protein
MLVCPYMFVMLQVSGQRVRGTPRAARGAAAQPGAVSVIRGAERVRSMHSRDNACAGRCATVLR